MALGVEEIRPEHARPHRGWLDYRDGVDAHDPSSTRASPSARSVAATSDSEPRYQKTPEWRTAKAKVEGSGWAR
jgi:hypothetical protein